MSLFSAVQEEEKVTILICTALLKFSNGQSHRIMQHFRVDETHKGHNVMCESDLVQSLFYSSCHM